LDTLLRKVKVSSRCTDETQYLHATTTAVTHVTTWASYHRNPKDLQLTPAFEDLLIEHPPKEPIRALSPEKEPRMSDWPTEGVPVQARLVS
jgi:hypothetical protein